MRTFNLPARTVLLAAFVISLLAGLLYYALFRTSGYGIAFGFVDPAYGSFPSFIHMLALTWLTLAWTGHRLKEAVQLVLLVLISTWAGECFLGYYDPRDLIAALLGTIAAFGTGLLLLAHNSDGPELNPLRSRALATAGLLTCSTVFITGTSPGYYDGSTEKPVYMSYEELRSSVVVEQPRELNSLGRLYLYEDYIFLNKRNEGIHILDNSDPANPTNLRFIAIPGNTEISIRDNYLYADSYIDLVTLDLNDPEQIQEINRQQDIFPYDEYQNVPADIYFSSYDLDPDKGVVVSYVK